ncbi:MAG: hypothetical protein ACR2PI_09085 [Hyphomicrobiaceae bacterium]
MDKKEQGLPAEKEAKAASAKPARTKRGRKSATATRARAPADAKSSNKKVPPRLSDLPPLELPDQLATTPKGSAAKATEKPKAPPPLPEKNAAAASRPPKLPSTATAESKPPKFTSSSSPNQPRDLSPASADDKPADTAATGSTPLAKGKPALRPAENIKRPKPPTAQPRAPSKPSNPPPPPADTPRPTATAAPKPPAAPPPPTIQPSLPVRGNAAVAAKPAYDEPISVAVAPAKATPLPDDVESKPPEPRRAARRRPAGPPRDRIAANDDAPSIGGLIYALNQRPSKKPFVYAAAGSGFWVVLALAFAFAFMPSNGGGVTGVIANPWFPTLIATILGPIALFGFLALLAWRTEELHMRSTAMTEVAVRLAEPDRMAEQSIASLGQAVRRQVSFMNDAVSRALGRAGELEALVHNEVSALEHSYEENERKIRGLIHELSNERHSLVNTGGQFEHSLQRMSVEIPTLMAQLSEQQLKLTNIIEGAGHNLSQLENALATQTGRFESSLGDNTTRLETVLTDYTEVLGSTIGSRTDNMQQMLSGYTEALGTALDSRADGIQQVLGGYTEALGSALESRSSQLQTMLEDKRDAIETNVNALRSTVETNVGQLQNSVEKHVGNLQHSVDEKTEALQQSVDRNTNRISESLTDSTETLQTVFEEYALALDTTLANRAEALDSQLVERTKALDDAFSERLRLFDESVLRSTMAIDSAVGENTKSLTNAMEVHARQLSDSIASQAAELDDTLMNGINSVRSTSENISRQSIKAIEGLAGQSDLLRNVSENLLTQINSVTNRFENQGQAIMRSANALETTNSKIERSLAGRTDDLNKTLERMSGKAAELSDVVEGYSTSLEGSLSGAQQRARMIADEISRETEARSRSALDDLQRVKLEASRETDRALEELRQEFSNVSQEVTHRLGALTNQFSTATGAVREQAAAAARDLEQEQERLKQQLDRLPGATEETARHMRRALGDQLRALDQLSNMANRSGMPDVSSPAPPRIRLPAPEGQSSPRGPAGRPNAGAGGTVANGLSSLTSTLQREMSHRVAPATGRPGPFKEPGQLAPPPNGQSDQSAQQLRQPNAAPQKPAQSDSWSLGDLLARASVTGEDDAGPPQTAGRAAQSAQPQPPAALEPPPQAEPGSSAPGLDVAALSRALDPATASTIWSRFQAGQRGFMVRSIYAPESRNLFDGIARRYRSDESFKSLVDRFLTEYENELNQADQHDGTGSNSQQLVQSDTGRVYLVLAHASGRLA